MTQIFVAHDDTVSRRLAQKILDRGGYQGMAVTQWMRYQRNSNSPPTIPAKSVPQA